MKKIIFLLAIAFTFSQCVYDDYQPVDTNSTDNSGTDTTTGTDTGTGTGTGTGTDTGTGTTTNNKTTYLGHVQPIISQLCLSCHSSVNPKDDFDISSYSKAKSKIDKIIKSMDKQGGEVMPPSGRASEDAIQTMKNWKADGLLEGEAINTGGTTGTGGTTAVTYAANIQPILAQQCTACHGATNASANLNLTTYANAKAKIDILISRIDLQTGQTGIMPTNGRMSEANIQAFKDWKAQGLLEQ